MDRIYLTIRYCRYVCDWPDVIVSYFTQDVLFTFMNKNICSTDTILISAVGSSAHGKVWIEMPLQVDLYWIWHVLRALGTLTMEPEWTSGPQVGKKRHCGVAVNLIHSCCDCEAAPWCCQTFCWTRVWTHNSRSISGTVEIKKKSGYTTNNWFLFLIWNYYHILICQSSI